MVQRCRKDDNNKLKSLPAFGMSTRGGGVCSVACRINYSGAMNNQYNGVTASASPAFFYCRIPKNPIQRVG